MCEKATGKKSVGGKTAPSRRPAHTVASAEKAIRELGWKRQFQKLENIVVTTWGWHEKHPGSDPD